MLRCLYTSIFSSLHYRTKNILPSVVAEIKHFALGEFNLWGGGGHERVMVEQPFYVVYVLQSTYVQMNNEQQTGKITIKHPVKPLVQISFKFILMMLVFVNQNSKHIVVRF